MPAQKSSISFIHCVATHKLYRLQFPSRREGLVEYYWGEHIHLGYYTEEERAKGYKKKDFKKAKYDFVDEMLKFSGAKGPKRVLDVGCGVGGTSRMLAEKFPEAEVQGEALLIKSLINGKRVVCEADRRESRSRCRRGP
jgi:2-polyprenyl-3-methyl-5-hydroxy-6-metoxy-1,4-benzoquinol methylase